MQQKKNLQHKKILEIYDTFYSLSEHYSERGHEEEVWLAMRMIFTVSAYMYLKRHSLCFEHGFEAVVDEIMDCLYEMERSDD